MYIIASCLLVWIICGIINAGLEFAYWQREFPRLSRYTTPCNTKYAWMDVLTGCLGLLITLSHGHHKHGWKSWFKERTYDC